MSTRGLIGIKEKNGWKVIYNHFDSYPEYLGRTLKRYYDTREKAEALIRLGNLSSVGKEIGKKHNFDTADNDYPNWTLAYGRDRGESNQEAKTVKDLKAVYCTAIDMGSEYVYLFNNGKWRAYEVNEVLEPISEKRKRVRA